MMVMTAKVDLKKIMLALAAVAALVAALIMLLGDAPETTQTAAPSLSSNDGRVKFLTDLGWEVTTSPAESGQVKIPSEESDAFRRYNALQKGQGYDLSKFAGKNVMRYVYKVNNYPGATEPVYATLLVYKNEIIGGDVTDTSARGKIQGFKRAELPSVTTTPMPTAASTETTG